MVDIDLSEVLEEETDDDEIAFFQSDASCVNCSRRNICVVLQSAAEVLHPENWQGAGEPPIQLDHLAVVCDEYEPEDEN